LLSFYFFSQKKQNREINTKKKKSKQPIVKMIVARPCRKHKDITVIITVGGGKYASPKTALGCHMFQGEPETHCVRTKCSSSRKMFCERDLGLTGGKLFTQQAERVKL
jgi:hypothetical protein